MKERARERPSVTVFGAGIAGLTAAHELVVRGFDVQVIDAEFNEEWEEIELPLDRGIGGMARSQWAVAVNSTVDSRSRSSGGFQIGDEWVQRLWSGDELLLDKAIDFGIDGDEPRDPKRGRMLMATLARAVKSLKAAGIPAKALSILVPIGDDSTVMEDRRVRYLVRELAKHKVKRSDVESMIVPWEEGKLVHDWSVYFAPSGGIAAAEHGFRFFPSFYRHVFDSMRRTTIGNPRDSERTKATVFGNLVPTEGLGFARAKKAISFIVPRRATPSFEVIQRILRDVLEQLEYSLADIARFQLKLFKYMTSSTERRRREYEHISWGAFLESERYSEISRDHIEYGPQMSAALRGSQSDARTQGNITVQLLLDQLKPDAEADYTLAGPTSGAWFDHWHDFLRRQGVRFQRGVLEGFDAVDGAVRPNVTGATARGEFCVLALSLPQIAGLADSFIEAASRAGVAGSKLSDFHKLKAFAGDSERDLQQGLPEGPLQHLSGIQFYFDQDVRFWRGHTQYLDSAWGLTSISQAQFWARQRQPDDDYRSILSVDIGIFDRPYRGKTAWECTADELARYTWEQIHDHHDDTFKQKYGPNALFPTPIAYALDSKLTFADRDGTEKRNHSPFLVNQTGKFPKRPGNIITAADRSKSLSVYDVVTSSPAGEARWGYVLAGTFMQTYTRLTSMEGANESARHAVNALLQFWGFGGDRCEIWDPEDHELDDLQWFKDLDEELSKRELPHFVDILGWSELPDQLIPHQLRLLASTMNLKTRRRDGE